MPSDFSLSASEALSAAVSVRSAMAAALMCLVTTARMSSGSASHMSLLARNQKPSHIWLVMEQNFCTS